jgi:Flp pilus assembly protein TadG
VKILLIRRRQSGLATVEFAIVGAIAITLVFAVLEIARAVFVISALNEATRRGARIAAVCPVNDPAIAEVATFNAPGAGSQSPIVNGLDTGDIVLNYLDELGDVIGDPSPGAGFVNVRYVRVSVVNFQHQLIIPFANITFTMPEFTTTLPRESLGIPRSWPPNTPIPPC